MISVLHVIQCDIMNSLFFNSKFFILLSIFSYAKDIYVHVYARIYAQVIFIQIFNTAYFYLENTNYSLWS